MSQSTSPTQPIQLADAFNDLLYGAGRIAPEDLTPIERHIEQQIQRSLQAGVPPGHIPRLPATTARALRRIDDPQTDVRELVGLVSEDASVAAEVLRLANSAYFRRGSRQITHLDQAVRLLGLDGLKSLLANALMRDVVRIRPIYFRMFGEHLWTHSQDCARACHHMARGRGTDRAQAYLLGLIHDVGKIVIFQLLVESFQWFAPGTDPRPEVFVKMIADNANALSLQVAREWGFPDYYIDALAEFRDKAVDAERSPLGETLFYGNLLAEAQGLLQRGRFDPEVIASFLSGFGANLDMIHELFGDPDAERTPAG